MPTFSPSTILQVEGRIISGERRPGISAGLWVMCSLANRYRAESAHRLFGFADIERSENCGVSYVRNRPDPGQLLVTWFS
ncbi:MAG: hypothetical protein K0U93_24530 [Gammaproteobacteria bacterium]|nr:hypothetical protein [Gammaproteobacteria bacterium]